LLPLQRRRPEGEVHRTNHVFGHDADVTDGNAAGSLRHRSTVKRRGAEIAGALQTGIVGILEVTLLVDVLVAMRAGGGTLLPARPSPRPAQIESDVVPDGALSAIAGRMGRQRAVRSGIAEPLMSQS
jgi:hypothetical protein